MSIRDPQVLHQQAVSNDNLGPAWSKKPRDSAQQMSDEDENLSHDDGIG